MNLEALRAPLGYTSFSRIPSVYDVLARERGAVVVELPFFAPREFFASAPYMLNSTRHWRPILNGYSGFLPASYRATYETVQAFPDSATIIDLKARGVTHTVVHAELFSVMYGRARFDAIARADLLEPVAESGDVHIYRLK